MCPQAPLEMDKCRLRKDVVQNIAKGYEDRIFAGINSTASEFWLMYPDARDGTSECSRVAVDTGLGADATDAIASARRYDDAASTEAESRALAELERGGVDLKVITQNIDGLHQAGGSKAVIELHGSVFENYCVRCGKKYELQFILDAKGSIPKCIECGGTVRPDVVLYEEALKSDVIQAAADAVDRADLMIVGGTSLVVYPAAGLVRGYSGGRLALVNKGVTPLDSKADLVIQDNVAEVLDEVAALCRET